MKATTTNKLPKIVSKYHCAGDYLVTDGTHMIRVCKVSVWSEGECEDTGAYWITQTRDDLTQNWTKRQAVERATKAIEDFRTDPRFAGQTLGCFGF